MGLGSREEVRKERRASAACRGEGERLASAGVPSEKEKEGLSAPCLGYKGKNSFWVSFILPISCPRWLAEWQLQKGSSEVRRVIVP